MKLVLKEPLNERKRWVQGEVFDWSPATVRMITSKLGRDDWYENSAKVRQAVNARALRPLGRPKKSESTGE